MKKLLKKMILYIALILISLEILIRMFHLTKDYPDRYVDEYGVEKWLPNQNGYSVTGNRRQNFSEYHINNFGYNSYREFKPSKEKVEIALVGDSFIEGFHQNYYNSLGKKIENRLEGVEVYEYGYAGYDFADQLHLISEYQEQFSLIDFVILGLKFDNDLTRGEYKVIQDRMVLESPLYKAIREVKLLVYLRSIGAFEIPKRLIDKILTIGKPKTNKLSNQENIKQKQQLNATFIENFKSLVKTYGYDKSRFVLLLDSNETPNDFLLFLKKNHYKYIDFSLKLDESKRPTTLIYDKHWNNHGRTLIAEMIVDFIQKTK